MPTAYVVINWLSLMCLTLPELGRREARSVAGPRFHEMLALVAFLVVPAVQYLLADQRTAHPALQHFLDRWACLFAGICNSQERGGGPGNVSSSNNPDRSKL